MLKQIKSAVIWFYLIKFKNKIFIMLLLISLAFLSSYIYADVVDYLKNTEQLHLLKYALIGKWGFIVGTIAWIIYSILDVFKKIQNFNFKDIVKLEKHQFSAREQNLLTKNHLKNQEEFAIANNENVEDKKISTKTFAKPELSAREKQLLEKDKLMSKADFILKK